jgi:U4/U6 small nuclear ribonucleoprotein PRP3
MIVVIVEGGTHSINAYKKLMLNRVKWTENAMPQNVREGNQEANAAWLNAFDEDGKLKDNTYNRCQLVFEGEEKQRAFKRWMPYKACETDGEAKDVLSRYKMENMWTLAQSPAFQ